MATNPIEPTRREFLKIAALTAVAVAGIESPSTSAQTQPAVAPWYRRATRWGQTNITEADVKNYDIPWWRKYWKRTAVQGVIVNAGGIFAYYPSKFPLHYRAAGLGDRDLFGELADAAHDDGLSVIARMDSSKAHENLFQAHPDWFGSDSSGQPFRSGDLYLTCINSPYYDQFIPQILEEIIERSHPEGFADNIWSGLERSTICYCKYCRDGFGKALPTSHDWNDGVYRDWIEWNYTRRIEQWELNNKITRAAGGVDCLWIGMNGAGVADGNSTFRDIREISRRSEIMLLDNQSRSDATGFSENALAGKTIGNLLGPDKIIIESMAMYQHGRPQFRYSAKSAAEARTWMLTGFAGGIGPWWHHVGAYHEDRRAYQTAEPLMNWHADNQQYLVNRKPVASVAIGWSRRNTDYFGRDDTDDLVAQPWRGFTQALINARIPLVPVHLDDFDPADEEISALILPNIGSMSDSQIAAIRRFVGRGGALVASGQTSLFDEWGDPRADFALSDLFGVSGGKPVERAARVPRVGNDLPAAHSYLRLTPELRAAVDGPMRGDEPKITGQRHPILASFNQTDILPYGGAPSPLRVDPQAKVLMTYIPPFPSTPPESSYMRTSHTDIPGLVIREGGSRVAYLAADIDRRFALYNFPDHGDLLANIVRWAAGDSIPLNVDAMGMFHCELYRQENRLILHVVNLTNPAAWRAPMREVIPSGPVRISLRIPSGIAGNRCIALVSGKEISIQRGATAQFQLDSIADHEVLVIS